MGVTTKTAVAEAYCAQMAGIPEGAYLIEETWDGCFKPAGDLWTATRKLRRSQRSVVPTKPESAHEAELLPAGYDKTAQLYRWVWLASPLTGSETAAVENATRILDRVHGE